MAIMHMAMKGNIPSHAPLYLDFQKNKYGLYDKLYTSATAIPGWSFARTSVGWAESSTGVWSSFASGVPRITDRGLLIEGFRTNLITNSNTWTNRTNINSTNITTGQASPDGTTTATLLDDSSTSLTCELQTESISFTATTYSISVFVKKDAVPASTRTIAFGFSTFVLTGDTSTGAFSVQGTGAAGLVISSGSWWRFTLIAPVPSSVSTYVYFQPARNAGPTSNTSADPTVIGSATVWNMDVEQGSYPSTPIFTTTIFSTRSSDIASITGLDTLLVTPFTVNTNVDIFYTSPTTLAQRYLLELNQTTPVTANRVYLLRDTTDTFKAISVNSSTVTTALNSSNKAGPRVVKTAFRESPTTATGACDNVLGTATALTAPTGLNRLDLGRQASNANAFILNAYIQNVSIAGNLPDTVLQVLTQ